MAENKLPKVLAISLSTWRKDSGIHTQTDLFKFWNPEKVAQIYLNRVQTGVFGRSLFK